MNIINNLQKASRILSTYTSPFIIAIAILSFIFPSSFLWVSGYTQTVILGIIMLSMGLTLTTNDFKILSSRPGDILIGTIAQYTIMPCIAWSLCQLFHLDEALSIGIILVGCCPGGVSSNIMSYLCKGDVAFSIGMTTVSTPCSIRDSPISSFISKQDRKHQCSWNVSQHSNRYHHSYPYRFLTQQKIQQK